MKNLTNVVALAALSFCNFNILQARAVDARPSVTVRFADLDTTHAPGAAALYARLKNAALRVCHNLEPDRRLALMSLYDECVHQAFSDAIIRIDRPAVTALAVSRGMIRGEVKAEIADNREISR